MRACARLVEQLRKCVGDGDGLARQERRGED